MDNALEKYFQRYRDKYQESVDELKGIFEHSEEKFAEQTSIFKEIEALQFGDNYLASYELLMAEPSASCPGETKSDLMKDARDGVRSYIDSLPRKDIESG